MTETAMRILPLLVALLAPQVRADVSSAHDGERRLKVLVLDPSSATVEGSVLTAIGGLISVELARIKALDIIASSDVKKITALEADKQASGCDESSCLADLAGALGARLVLFGDASKLGTLLVLNLNLFDSTKAQSVGRVSVQAKSLEELPALLSPAVRDLVRDALKGEGIVIESAPAMTVIPQPPSPLAAVWTWGLVGGGTVVALGGLVYDSIAPSSGDGALDALDIVGPGLIVIGAAAIGGGLLFQPFGGGDD